MKLADLRKLAIRRECRIRFTLRDGLECVMNEHGVAQSPGLRSAPAFNFEQELADARQFRIEPAAAGKDAPQPRAVSREELETMLGSAAEPGARSAAAHDED